MKPNRGYTLIEMMVVVGILGFLMAGIVGLFVSMLRGQGKTNALARVKHEGDTSSVVLEQTIRDGFDCDLPSASVVRIYKKGINDPTKITAYEIRYNDTNPDDKYLEVEECQEAATKTCTAYTPPKIRRLTSEAMTVNLTTIDCKERIRFDHDMVMVDYALTDKKVASLEVPFRVITTLRNVENK